MSHGKLVKGECQNCEQIAEIPHFTARQEQKGKCSVCGFGTYWKEVTDD